MAKINPSLISINGKIGDSVIVKRNGKEYIRKAPKAGSKKNEPVLKYQYKRTKLLNKLAGEINAAIKTYRRNFKDRNFYIRLQSQFRKEPSDNRFMLLYQLKEMEINPKYKSEKRGYFETTVTQTKKNIIVNFETIAHPIDNKLKSDSYYYEVVLLTWDKSKKALRHSNQFTEWIFKNKGLPDFEFELPKYTGITNWLLCVYRRLGENSIGIENFFAESMLIADVGSFDKKEQGLLNKRNKEKADKTPLRKKVDDVERVKAKRMK